MQEIELDREKWALDLLEEAEQENEALRAELDAVKQGAQYERGWRTELECEVDKLRAMIASYERKIRVLEEERRGQTSGGVVRTNEILKEVWMSQKFPEAFQSQSVPPKEYRGKHGKNKRNGRGGGR